MQVNLVDNARRTLVSVLGPLVGESRDIRVAVAFVSRKGLSLISESLEVALSRGATAEFLVGLDLRTTEPGALDSLFTMSRERPGVDLYCYASLASEGVYHPKLYLLSSDERAACIVGSSNLTVGGLRKNVECNVLLEGRVDDEPISDAYETYARLKFHPRRVAPDDEFLTMYARICEQDETSRRARAAAYNRLVREFEAKAATLRGPVPTARDLVGWLGLVYESLPDGEFTNQEVYSREAEFAQRFPHNMNVRAKVRQQLQMLRDLGFVQHLGAGRWRKAGD